MTETRKRALAGIVGLVSAGLFSMGCGSKATGSGTGGNGGGVGGAGGGGGATIGCQKSAAPASALIADFHSADGGVAMLDGLATYGPTATDHPMYSIGGGTLDIIDNVGVGSKAQYVGLVIYFNGSADGTECVDASAYTGVQFDISGTLMGPGCSIQYSTNDSEHADATATGDPKASGPSGSYAPQLPIPSIMPSPQTMMVPFADPGLNPGSPSTPIDKTKITGVQWQMTVPAASDGGPTECDLNLTVDNVKFY
jgi:hypothetical protein